MLSRYYLGSAWLLVFLCLLNSTSFAQPSSVHGAAIVGLEGGGCLNLTGTCTDPLCPPDTPHLPADHSPGKIPCKEYLRTAVTFQSLKDGKEYYVGKKIGDPLERKYADELGVEYIETAINSELVYGLGMEHYSEFNADSWYRTRWPSIKVPNLTEAINANPDYKAAYALLKVVDGSALKFTIENQNQILFVPKDQEKSFEIYIEDPSGFTNFSNPNRKPFQFVWVTPDKASTPHLSIPDGINLTSRFDSQANRWRYFIEASPGPRGLNVIGNYIVHFRIEETTPRRVQYCSLVEHLLTYDASRYIYATLTLAYGIDQCISQAGVKMPSMEPLLKTYEDFLTKTTAWRKKIMRRLKALRLMPFGSGLRMAAAQLKQKLSEGKAYLAEAREMNNQALATDLGKLSAAEQAVLVLNLKKEASLAVTSKRSSFNMSLIAKHAKTMVPRKNARGKSGPGKPGIPRVFRNFINQGFYQFEQYLAALDETQNKLEKLRQNQIECSQIK